MFNWSLVIFYFCPANLALQKKVRWYAKLEMKCLFDGVYRLMSSALDHSTTSAPYIYINILFRNYPLQRGQTSAGYQWGQIMIYKTFHSRDWAIRTPQTRGWTHVFWKDNHFLLHWCIRRARLVLPICMCCQRLLQDDRPKYPFR